MKISHGTNIRNIATWNGFGYATDRMIDSLTRLGHEVKQNDPTAPVQIWFADPTKWTWFPNQYKIGYFPWESSEIYPELLAALNQCDEVWTPSPLMSDWFPKAGVRPPVFVYEHGVDANFWEPHIRYVDDTFNFLHLGAEAPRKGAKEAMAAFRAAFPHRDDVTLTLKMIQDGWKINSIGRTKIINTTYDDSQLRDLFYQSHCYVYPSTGEGFGLTPLQAMATGMPTITVPHWAPYERFLDPRLKLTAELGESRWNGAVHPGKVFYPDVDDLVDKMRWVVDNYDDAQVFAHDQIAKIKIDYDWMELTRTMFESLEERLKNK